MPELIEIQLERLRLAGLKLSDKALEEYLNNKDVLIKSKDSKESVESMPAGYKRCGKCTEIKKLHLFNKNNSSKLCCTGNCKECQKEASKKSYKKTKDKIDHKEYYQKNRERKLAANKKYYQENKEKRAEAHKKYRNSNKGKAVMRKAHAKRRDLLQRNSGVPYKREWVIERDCVGGEHPICYLCGKPILFEREIQLDHVIPVVLGGPDCFTNIACTHQLCNLTKSKDAREVEVEHVETIIERAEAYIVDHEQLFEESKK